MLPIQNNLQFNNSTSTSTSTSSSSSIYSSLGLSKSFVNKLDNLLKELNEHEEHKNLNSKSLTKIAKGNVKFLKEANAFLKKSNETTSLITELNNCIQHGLQNKIVVKYPVSAKDCTVAKKQLEQIMDSSAEVDLTLYDFLSKFLCDLGYEADHVKTFYVEYCKTEKISLPKVVSKYFPKQEFKEKLKSIDEMDPSQLEEFTNIIYKAFFMLWITQPNLLHHRINDIFAYADLFELKPILLTLKEKGYLNPNNSDGTIRNAFGNALLIWSVSQTDLSPKLVLPIISHFYKQYSESHHFSHSDFMQFIQTFPELTAGQKEELNLFAQGFAISGTLDPTVDHWDPDFLQMLLEIDTLQSKISSVNRGLLHAYKIWDESLNILLKLYVDIDVTSKMVASELTELTIQQNRSTRKNKKNEKVFYNKKLIEKNLKSQCVTPLAHKMRGLISIIELRRSKLKDLIEQMKSSPFMLPVVQIYFEETINKISELLPIIKETCHAGIEEMSGLEEINCFKLRVEGIKDLLYVTEGFDVLKGPLLLSIEEEDATQEISQSDSNENEIDETIFDDPTSKVKKGAAETKRKRHRAANNAIERVEEIGLFQNIQFNNKPTVRNDNVDISTDRALSLSTEIESLGSAKKSTLTLMTPYLMALHPKVFRKKIVSIVSLEEGAFKKKAFLTMKGSDDHLMLASQGFELFVNTLLQKDFKLARVALRNLLLDCSIAIELDLEKQKAIKGITDYNSQHSLLKLAKDLSLKTDGVLTILDMANLALRYPEDYKNSPVLQWLDHFDLLAANPQSLETLKLEMLPSIFECFAATCRRLGYPEAESFIGQLQQIIIANLDNLKISTESSSTKETVTTASKLHKFIQLYLKELNQSGALNSMREAESYLKLIENSVRMSQKYSSPTLKFWYLRNQAEGEKVLRAFLKAAAISRGCGSLLGHHYSNFIEPLKQEAKFSPFKNETKVLNRCFLGITHHYTHLGKNSPYVFAMESSLKKTEELGFTTVAKPSSEDELIMEEKLKEFSQEISEVHNIINGVVNDKLKLWCNIK